MENRAAFITTRGKTVVYPPCNVSRTDPECGMRTGGQVTDFYYYADVEKFTVCLTCMSNNTSSYSSNTLFMAKTSISLWSTSEHTELLSIQKVWLFLLN